MGELPCVGSYMTRSPHSVDADQTLAQARSLMHEHRIRHLPVLRRGQLVGIISDRDLHIVGALKGSDAQQAPVSAAMTTNVYAVPTEAPLDEVVITMGTHKYGCAVVMDDERVAGIFTTVDVCVAFADLLNSWAAK
jgi:acetoin utilization protein AcuB